MPTLEESESIQANQYYSAPTLMDLLNEDNISPEEVNIERLKAEWFENLDPYDLAESDCLDSANPDDLLITRCSTRWKVGELVWLNGAPPAALIKHLSGNDIIPIMVGGKPDVSHKSDSFGSLDDWEMSKFV
ncbi:hypothetical protein C0991_012595 [Blastosporella zonata]|nr:hypothetical protein C0991_012595 [Blastosporella zonata]